MYRRILLKLSGEALVGDQRFGIAPDVVARLADEIKDVHGLGVETAVVLGGGNIIRGVSAAAQGIDRVVHLLLDVLELLPHASAPPAVTSDPMFSPRTTRWMLPRTFRLKTLMGIPFSMQSATAAASIT